MYDLGLIDVDRRSYVACVANDCDLSSVLVAELVQVFKFCWQSEQRRCFET